MANLPLSYFESLVAGAVRVRHPDDVKPIALICFEAGQRGEHMAAWHASAQFYGYLHRCNCVPCKTEREAAAPDYGRVEGARAGIIEALGGAFAHPSQNN